MYHVSNKTPFGKFEKVAENQENVRSVIGGLARIAGFEKSQEIETWRIRSNKNDNDNNDDNLYTESGQT